MRHSDDGGLRERKKTATRALIVEVADELFLEHGFGDVTLDQVADACEISVRTVLRYFESKDALALSHEHDRVERFRSGLDGRPDGVVAYWRSHVESIARDVAGRPEWWRRRQLLIRRHLPTHAGLLRILDEFRDLLAEALVEEHGEDNRLGAQLLAALLVAGSQACTVEWIAGRGGFDVDGLVAAVDYAEELFADRLGSQACPPSA